jgi:hypothetical protein
MPDAVTTLDYAPASHRLRWRRWVGRGFAVLLVLVSAWAAWVVWPRVSQHMAVLRAQEKIASSVGPWKPNNADSLVLTPVGSEPLHLDIRSSFENRVLHMPEMMAQLQVDDQTRFVTVQVSPVALLSVSVGDGRGATTQGPDRAVMWGRITLTASLSKPSGIVSSGIDLPSRQSLSLNTRELGLNGVPNLISPPLRSSTDASRFYVDLLWVPNLRSIEPQSAQRVRIYGRLDANDQLSLARRDADELEVALIARDINGMPLFPVLPDPLQ